jgi:predicted TIM-barrel fold metal-dependent hydrolase
MITEHPHFDPHTRAPARKAPPLSCDCHVHVYGSYEAFPLAPTRIFDPPEDADAAALARMHDVLGVQRTVLIQPTGYRSDHRLMARLLEADPARYRGVAILDDEPSDEELARLNDLGVRGARLNLVSWLPMPWSPDSVKRIVARLDELGWHADLHVDPLVIEEHRALLEAFPVPIVIDHLGHIDPDAGTDQAPLRLLCELIAEHGWWIKLSNGDRMSNQGAPYDDAVPIARRLLEAAPDRALWATDWPHVQYKREMPNDADLLELLDRIAPEEDLRARVLVDNPARLYGWDTPAGAA